jgi:hypothetical protein
MKALYRLQYWGLPLFGIFVEDKEKVEWLIQEQIKVKIKEDNYIFDEDSIEMLTDDESKVAVVERFELEFGVNPFWHPTGDYETVNESYDEFIRALK